jgi:WS/DGAT/MGAT family acyltransferase
MRHRLRYPLGNLGRPFWVNDPTFDIDYHVRALRLPEPSGAEELRDFVSNLYSRRLEMDRPLWEMWLVSGLADGWAVVYKAHHGMSDGTSSVKLGLALTDESRILSRDATDDWSRAAGRGSTRLALTLRGLLDIPLIAGRQRERVRAVREHPRESRERARVVGRGAGELIGALVTPSPRLPLNEQAGPHREIVWVGHRLDELARVRKVFGGTINDVYVSAVAGGLRRWLETRGMAPDAQDLYALLPITVRKKNESGKLGNRISALRAPLPVGVANAAERLALVREATISLRYSAQAAAGEAITQVDAMAPPAVLARTSLSHASPRVFNVIVSNIRVPNVPVHVLGRELADVFVMPLIPPQHALAVASITQHGNLNVAFMVDRQALPDNAAIVAGYEDALAELVKAADSVLDERAAAAQTPEPVAGRA